MLPQYVDDYPCTCSRDEGFLDDESTDKAIVTSTEDLQGPIDDICGHLGQEKTPQQG